LTVIILPKFYVKTNLLQYGFLYICGRLFVNLAFGQAGLSAFALVGPASGSALCKG
jgi:hypothetical protein